MSDRATLGTLLAIGLAVALTTACATAATRARLTPADVSAALITFHADVLAAAQGDGLEQEHALVVTTWVADTLRVLSANPRQWEGQARLQWPRVRSICVPFERLGPAVARLDAVLQ